jgi:hypothetical protein
MAVVLALRGAVRPFGKLVGLATIVGALAGCSGGQAQDPDAGRVCEPDSVPPVELVVGTQRYPTSVLAEQVLRSDLSTQGLEYPDAYAPRLAASVQRHRVGEVLMQVGFVLRDVIHEPSGNYDLQVANLMDRFTTNIESVLAVGGHVRLQIHCATPAWLATHPYPHSALTGVAESTGEPVSACSAPTDPAQWRAIMRSVGEHFAPYADGISFSIGSEPENYFVGSLAELLDWYAATAGGLLDSSGAASFCIGGLTMVGHKTASLTKTAPTLQGNTITFTRVDYAEPITKTWIQHCAGLGLPLDLVTLHQFGGSPVPAVGTFWGIARRDISAWLGASGYPPDQVEVVIEDWPQWAPYPSNDTEYFAAHVASGILSMLDLSLREGAPVRLLQGFLFDFGFRPPGDFPAGFTGRPGLSNEMGLAKPVFNFNSLLAEVEGTVWPVQSSDPFVHAIAATGPDHATVLVVNQIPLEYQVDLLYDYWEQRPIFENNFVAEDLSAIAYDLFEIIEVFYGGVMPPWPELIDDFLSDPSSIDLEQLRWPDEIKAQWTEMRRIGRLARPKRACNTAVRLGLDGLPDGRYGYEHYVLDSQHANTYQDREILDQRLREARADGNGALLQEILDINREYDAESGKLAESEVVLGQPREPIVMDMEPNSIHLLRFTANP